MTISSPKGKNLFQCRKRHLPCAISKSHTMQNHLLVFQCRERHLPCAIWRADNDKQGMAEVSMPQAALPVHNPNSAYGMAFTPPVSMPQAALPVHNDISYSPATLRATRFNAASGICPAQFKSLPEVQAVLTVSMPQAALPVHNFPQVIWGDSTK